MPKRRFLQQTGRKPLILEAKKCIIYANEPNWNGKHSEMMLDFTNMPKNKQQFDDFEQ